MSAEFMGLILVTDLGLAGANLLLSRNAFRESRPGSGFLCAFATVCAGYGAVVMSLLLLGF